VCQVAKADSTPLDGEPLIVTNPDEELRWWPSGLTAGTYKLRVLADRSYDGEVDLQGGDRMIVKLVEAAGGGIGFERAIYAEDDDFQDATKATGSDDWRLSILPPLDVRQGQVERLRLLAALESKSSSSPLRQLQPAMVGFQLGAEGIPDPSASIAL